MKNLLLILALFIGLNSFGQVDTTVFFESETINKTFPIIQFESEFKTVDTILFDINQDSTLWNTSRWRRKDSIYVNPNSYIIKQVQFRMNDQGIKQRRARRIKYTNREVTKRRIRN